MYILGISAFFHDSAACIIKNGKIIAAAQEERFTRKKHDPSFPKNAIEFCLSYAKITASDLSYITFYEKPFVKFERILETYYEYAPKGCKSFIKAMQVWFNEKLWIKEIIKREVEFKGDILFCEHHYSHAASAFYPSPFKNSAILTVDGVGEWTTSSFGIGENNDLEIICEQKYPHSLGLLYSAFTYYLGFKVNSGEYKVMGLAPYGAPKYVSMILNEMIDLKEDGSFKMNMKFFDFCAGLKMTNSKFDELFGGPARNPESEITLRHMNIAASIQFIVNEIMLKMAKHIKKVTNQDNLCIAGGVGLNCVANGKILNENIFDDLWIQPAAGDAGGAIGAALYTWYKYLNNERLINHLIDSQHGSFLGPEYSGKEVEIILNKEGVRYTDYNEKELYAKVADYLNNQEVIGLFSGRMEFGPRALGNRSIIGDARSPLMQSIMNRKIKHRESFRPFAPAVLVDKMSDYFNIEKESPYMLLTVQVKTKKESNTNMDICGFEKLKTIQSELPAITHVDNSARVHSVDYYRNPRLYKIISAFDKKFGSAVIINTSFNVRGEPIVNTIYDALTCFFNTEMDCLVMNNYIIRKELNMSLINVFKYKQIPEPD